MTTDKNRKFAHPLPAAVAAVAGVLVLCVAGSAGAAASMPSRIPMTSQFWQPEGSVTFERMEGFPEGRLAIAKGGAVLKQLHFAEGTIEFDARFDPKDLDLPTIRFHRDDQDDAEEFYLRPDDDCPAANDCVQYTPVFHGAMTWDMYPEYQAAAPISIAGWNHVRLVVAHGGMRVFINGRQEPVLNVPVLQGIAREGTLEFRGPATFANLVVAEAVDDTPAAAAAPEDPRLLRHWRVGTPAALQPDNEAAAPPVESTSAERLDAEAGGLVNLNRRFGPAAGVPSQRVWLQTHLASDRVQDKRVAFGWLRQARVFVNGQLVFKDENPYRPEAARKTPDGRLALDNSSFVLPLRKGDNVIAVEIGDDFSHGEHHYGWGMKLRLDDLAGITLPQA